MSIKEEGRQASAKDGRIPLVALFGAVLTCLLLHEARWLYIKGACTNATKEKIRKGRKLESSGVSSRFISTT